MGCNGAERDVGGGGAMGGMIMGVRKGLEMKEEEDREREGMMVKKVRLGGDWWRIIGVYVNKDLQGKLEELKEWTEEREEGVRMVIEGDFNARTGTEGGGRYGAWKRRKELV